MNIISCYFLIFFLKEIFCFEKIGWLEELSTSTESWGYKHLEEELPPEFSFDDIRLRAFVLREGRMPKRNIKESDNKSLEEEGKKLFKKGKYSLEEEQLFTGHRRLVEEILDNYDPTGKESTRINLSMSLYQILDVDERRQSIVVNVWMVQNWFDEVLYNSEEMNKKSTEALMNAIVETGHWRKDGKGATVQLMFPAIYKLSCRMNVRFFPYDQQNCSFIISSWTHDSSTIDYYFERPTVNLLNFAQNDEWTVISFNFQRIEQQFKCCKNPWTMLYAHLVYFTT